MGISKCILCGSPEYTVIFEKRDSLGCSERIFKVVECRKCFLRYTLPYLSPEEIVMYYPGKYYGQASYIPKAKATHFEAWFSRLYSRILWKVLLGKGLFPRGIMRLVCNIFSLPFYRYRNRCLPYKDTPGRLLDIGCGNGTLLARQKRLGWDVYGIELDEEMAEYAREQRGLNVTAGGFKGTEYGECHFDIINMDHVLEHFLDPLSEMRKVRRLLKNDGYAVLRIPDSGGMESRVFGRFWNAYDVPRHRFHFNGHTLKNLAQESGMKISGILPVLDINNMILSIRNILKYRNAPESIVRNFSVENKTIRAVFLVPAFLLRLIGQCGEMLVYMEKDENGQG